MKSGFVIATSPRAAALGVAARAGSMGLHSRFGKRWSAGMYPCQPQCIQLDPRENTTLPGEGHT